MSSELHRAFEARRGRYERAETRKMTGALAVYSSGILDRIKNELTPEQAIDAVRIYQSEAIKNGYESLYINVGPDFGQSTYRALLRQTKKAQYSDFIDFASNFVKMSAKRIKSVEGTVKSDIIKTLERGIKEGASIDRVVSVIQSGNIGFETWRGARIARTEIVSASNYASADGARLTGLQLQKEWLATIDGRERADHGAMNGAIVEQEESFDVGGIKMYLPGDVDAPADQVINCRCAVGWINK